MKIVIAYKILIILACVLLCSSFVAPGIASICGANYFTIETIQIVLSVAAMTFGVVVLIFPFIFRNMEIAPTRTKAEKNKITIGNFSDFLKSAQNALSDCNFTEIASIENDLLKLFLFAKSKALKLEIVSVIYSDELTDEIIAEVDLLITNCLKKYHRDHTLSIFYHHSLIPVFCVNRLTKDFCKLLNSDVQQNAGHSKMISGISFGEKKLYIAKQKGGLGVLNYKRYRKHFFELFPFLKK